MATNCSHADCRHGALLVMFLIACGCSDGPVADSSNGSPSAAGPAVSTDGEQEAIEAASSSSQNPLRNAYFGDLHVHTRYSFDAYVFKVRGTPDDAYRYAKGEPLTHPIGHTLQLRSGPLDFQAVTDHDLYLGAMLAMDDPESPLYEEPLADELRGLDTGGFARALAAARSGELAAMDTEDATLGAWQDIVAAAERHNDPGTFTTFVGYEYTLSADDRGNLHRNVIFRGDAPDRPFAVTDSRNPADLWRWLDDLRQRGIEGLAIPHNSNGSNGQMFMIGPYADEPFDANYADLRMRNEPLVEVTQVKGDSEAHPLLNPYDEWANYEVFPYRIATQLYSEPSGGYVREAYLNGLKLEEKEGFNPFRFGLIGSTDSHNAAPTPEEFNFHSKVGINDGTPQRRGSVPLDQPLADGSVYPENDSYIQFGAAGLAGVWAEENTRDSLYEALRRKETFATTGPRMRVRFFAGYDYKDGLVDDRNMIEQAYAGGVPMGGDLARDGDRVPRFLVWALRDVMSAPLQRVQVIKGWVEDGEARERVYDVACSDGGVPDANHRCPDNGARVDLTDCSISTGVGASELGTLWSDPDFDPTERAFYYVRTIENPVCRWSTWDALRAGVPPREGFDTTIQERAYTSPIWYLP